jgi:hypothetical protein
VWDISDEVSSYLRWVGIWPRSSSGSGKSEGLRRPNSRNSRGSPAIPSSRSRRARESTGSRPSSLWCWRSGRQSTTPALANSQPRRPHLGAQRPNACYKCLRRSESRTAHYCYRQQSACTTWLQRGHKPTNQRLIDRRKQRESIEQLAVFAVALGVVAKHGHTWAPAGESLKQGNTREKCAGIVTLNCQLPYRLDAVIFARCRIRTRDLPCQGDMHPIQINH